MHNINYKERIELWNLENEKFMELIIHPSLNYYHRYFERAPDLTDRGLGWTNIWLRLQQDASLQLLRMSIPCFIMLCDTLQTNYSLQPIFNMSIEESVAIFLRICGHNEIQRDVGLRFCRNQETVQRKFTEVLRATELLACDCIRTPTREDLDRVPESLIQDRRYWPLFNGFVEAMDGTHVCVKVKQELQGIYWDRHNNPSLNIMKICDLNMFFTYIWNGAPGSCQDTTVLTMAQQSDSEFPLLSPEKYYLVDSGYPNKQGFLAPYRSSQNTVVRYHMAQFNSGPAPRNKQELFNQNHASMRSVIQRTFTCWKKKWRIVKKFLRYSVKIQKRVVMTTMGLNIFIKISDFADPDFANVMAETNINNIDSEYDLDDIEGAEATDGHYMI
ncbi:protein ANTAGONIST OF LIKE HETEROCHROMATIN PROTEIN 1-like [Eutrema salsugineum]|uniref:protein ANTAGONIST OF LIKE HETEROCHROMATIN PROTEIN 1-like n=1 Tax=Eutrema salsugineum TaxID=72664 RepID=UPI000CECFBF4|nr:protein ANTAGONIST OF LIKE HETEROCHROMATIN PROTEIN 1-like [Eutrema salsugineum]